MQNVRTHGFLYRFLLRWLVCSLGLWIAAGLLRGSINYQHHLSAVIFAGLILAAINTIIKPLLVLATLPAILLTLGLFMLIINGVTVWLAAKIAPDLHITNFLAAIITGIIIGLVNYLVTAVLEEK